MSIPQTAGALLAFLALVAPGIVFEQLREKRRVGADESVFREISRIALASLALTVASSAIVLLIGVAVPQLSIDPRRWFVEGAKYAQGSFYHVLGNLAAELALACVLAFIVDQVLHKLGRGKGNLSRESLWDQIFRKWKPEDATPWVHVELSDGSSFYGYLMGATAGSKTEERELVLESPFLSHRRPRSADGTEAPVHTIGLDWEFVIVPSKQIKYARVVYRKTAGGAQSWSERRLAALIRDQAIAVGPPDNQPTAT